MPNRKHVKSDKTCLEKLDMQIIQAMFTKPVQQKHKLNADDGKEMGRECPQLQSIHLL
jgi:hypothetical protein